jgi:hypothetical protein
MRRPIENNSSPGQAIYDPFCGSGTTIIAAEMTGRSCFAIDIDPAYVDVSVLRWQAFTGEDARLDQDRRSFTEVAAEWAERSRANGASSTQAGRTLRPSAKASSVWPPRARGAMCGRLIDAPGLFPLR